MTPALSIRQPWAWLIVNGHKDIENRDWATPFRGRFLVHASKTITRKAHDECRAQCEEALPFTSRYDWPAFEDLQLGGFVGWSTVEDCVREHPSPWKQPDSYGFVLRDSTPIPFVPYSGRLGWFNVPNGTIEKGSLTMAGRTKPKRTRRVWDGKLNPLEVALNAATRLTKDERDRLIQPLRDAMAALRQGKATEFEWLRLATCVQVAICIEDQGVVRGLREHLAEADVALCSIADRAHATGAWRSPHLLRATSWLPWTPCWICTNSRPRSCRPRSSAGPQPWPRPGS